ncbi:FLZ-type domain-containing protein [Heracleum sosnowskyi]|uniref:FLZ-type domain-containing protein n=1 Tax=Heracleum sosnowskyi TaxID=360622 RepID=A0AAD8GZV4_9APIA|nr:FLZ-type domain-containing protein [Heracleum sosnowskyi]
MSAKRSRLGDSSSFIEKDLNHMPLPVKYAREVCGASSLSDVRKPSKCLKTSLDEGNKEQLWKNTVLKPTARESVSGGIGSFLKHCYYCKKMIDQGEDVFMYRDLCAFCTEECRDHQIELDEKIQRQSAESSGVIQKQDMNEGFFLNH